MGDITYSVVNVTGKLCLLSYGRIKKEDLDPTLFKYDIQSTDDGFEPSAIKKFVLVNHWGTLITKDKLELDEYGWLFLDDHDFIHLSDEYLSINDFLKLSDEQHDKLLQINQHKKIDLVLE